jgi:mRNA interferase HigB
LTSGSQDENNQRVHVISRKALVEFVRIQPKGAEPLDNWYRRTKRATWKNIAELRIDYPHADLVGSCIVFNIGGNKYRLIAKIKFQKQTVYIRFVLTHREYNKEGWRNDCIT